VSSISSSTGSPSPSARIDVIVIEASGLAEPQELVKMLLASENPRVVYGGLVEVVDAAEFDATRQKHPEIDRHLALADLVVVNKADRATDPDRVIRVVRSLTDRAAAVVPASYGRIDPEFLFDRRPTEERIGQLSFDDLHRHEEGAHDGPQRPPRAITAITAICTPPTSPSPSPPKCPSAPGG
jgi:G3E family GTPase